MRATAFACVWFLLLVHVAGGTDVPLTDVPMLDRENPQAGGIILSFHRWPDEEEAAVLLQKTTAAGLNKTKEFERFKAWVFEWPELREGREAQEICDNLPQISSLAYCEPDYLLGPAGPVGSNNVGLDASNSFNPIVKLTLIIFYSFYF